MTLTEADLCAQSLQRTVKVPETLKKEIKKDEQLQWSRECVEELDSMKKLNLYEQVDTPTNRQHIETR